MSRSSILNKLQSRIENFRDKSQRSFEANSNQDLAQQFMFYTQGGIVPNPVSLKQNLEKQPRVTSSMRTSTVMKNQLPTNLIQKHSERSRTKTDMSHIGTTTYMKQFQPNQTIGGQLNHDPFLSVPDSGPEANDRLKKIQKKYQIRSHAAKHSLKGIMHTAPKNIANTKNKINFIQRAVLGIYDKYGVGGDDVC